MTYKEQKEQIDNNIFAKARAMMCGEYDEIIDGAEIEELQERINKAIEFIKSLKNDYQPYELTDFQIRNLLSILQGEEVK